MGHYYSDRSHRNVTTHRRPILHEAGAHVDCYAAPTAYSTKSSAPAALRIRSVRMPKVVKMTSPMQGIIAALFAPETPLDCSSRLNEEQAIAIAQRYVASRHPSAVFAAIYGSATRNQLEELSDMDVLVVRPDSPLLLKEQVLVNSRMVQALMVSSDVLHRAIASTRTTFNSFFPNILAESRLIYGDHTSYEAAKRQATESLAAGLGTMRRSRLGKPKSSAASQILKLMRLTDKVELKYRMIMLVQATQEFILLHHGAWLGDASFRLDQLREVDPEAVVLMDEGLELSIIATDPYPLIHATLKIFDRYGGLRWETTGGPVDVL